jgi:hypothetical protein
MAEINTRTQASAKPAIQLRPRLLPPGIPATGLVFVIFMTQLSDIFLTRYLPYNRAHMILFHQ